MPIVVLRTQGEGGTVISRYPIPHATTPESNPTTPHVRACEAFVAAAHVQLSVPRVIVELSHVKLGVEVVKLCRPRIHPAHM